MKESGGMDMSNRLIIDENSVYEIDEECVKEKSGAQPVSVPKAEDITLDLGESEKT